MSSFADSVFNYAVKSVFKQDFHLVNNEVERAKKIASLERRPIIESVRRIAEYASDIAEIVLSLTIDDAISIK